MGTSVVGQLSEQQTAQLPAMRDAMAAVANNAIPSTRFTFAAFFDGTNNDLSQYAPDSTVKPQSGDPFPTNVANLYIQAKGNETDTFQVRYRPGIGTGDERGGQINAGVAPNAPAHAIAEEMYQDFRKAAIEYLDTNPNASVEDISTTMVGGSRGGAVGIKFMQMVDEQGLVRNDGTVLAPPHSIPAVSPVFLDAVGRFVDGDLSLPPNVRGPVLSVQAADENRSDFRPLDFTNDERVTTVVHPGNHVGVLGGYDQGGTASNVLEGVTAFMQKTGQPIADVPVEQRFNPEVQPEIYTEAYRTDTQGHVLTNENGDKLLAWSVDDPTKGRQLDPAEHPGAMTEEQHAANSAALLSNLASLGHWSELTDSQRLAVVGALYNTVDHMNAGDMPGDLGSAVSALGFFNALEHGNTGSAIVSGVSLANNLGEDFASKEIGAAVGMDATNVVPGLNLTLALESGNTTSIVAAAASFIPVYGPLISVGLSLFGGDLFGDDDPPPPPPPPEGAVHFSWDASGHIQYTVDYNQSGGGDAANQIATSVQTLLQSVVDAHNAQNPSTADDIAINPYLLPRFGYSAGGAWMEVCLPDGTPVREGLNQEDFAQRLLEVLQDNGGIAPAWQVQTEQVKWQHAQEHLQQLQDQRDALMEEPLLRFSFFGGQHVRPGQEQQYEALSQQINQVQAHLNELTHDFKLGIGGQAVAGDEAFSLQGNAAESADFKSQTFGALVVHLGDNPNAQAAQNQLNTVLRDVEGDGYFEKTQTVAAKDNAGNLQAVLTIDFNGDGVIQTRDILNFGGNTAQGNPTDEARLANEHADQQRNNVQWLDANGDGVLDKSDPAFAAIKLWVDVSQDGSQQAGEAASLSSQHISSINFRTGEVTYDDGHTDALTAQTLKADTEGVKLTQIQEVNPDGTLHTLDAGMVLEHEGYQGKVQITDEGGTRWASAREQTYEQQALRTGDWEGTAEQDAHRHGGGNVDDAPTQTTATGATSQGDVKTQANAITQSALNAGDERVVSDAPTQAPQTQTNAQTSVGAGDSRIKSNVATPNASTTNTTTRPADTRIVFVPTSQTSVQSEIQAVTVGMIENSQSLLFGAGANAGLGVLTAVGLGAVQSAQATEHPPVLEGGGVSSTVSSVSKPVSSDNTLSSTSSGGRTDASTATVTFKHVDLGVFNVPQVVPTSNPTTPPPNTVISDTVSTLAAPPSTALVHATVIVSTPAQVTPTKAPVSAISTSALTVGAPTLGYPEVQGETLAGTEDVVLRLPQSLLLANDSTPNASADPNAPALTITAVSAPLHGQVSLVNGEVLFAPDANFHGTASFTYTVTDQYGLSTNSTATLVVAAVNDAPVTQGESVSSDEDIGLIFTQAQLLANDTDVDIATDGQVLSISRVGQAEHGTVWLDAQGNLRFVPDANYHGPAQFKYWVSDGLAADGAGAETPATVSLTILAVNDLPVVTGETLNNRQEDVPLLFNPATLLANDTDVDTATDGQVLTITNISHAQHGTVAWATQPDGSQYIEFTPEANYFGVASYQYTVSDGHGGSAVGTVVLNLTEVNDTPVAVDDSLSSTAEDTALHISFTSLLGNDTDADSHNSQWGGTDDVLTVSAVGNAVHGTVALVNGEVVFTPDANYHGSASFAYQVRDSRGAVAQALATFSVTAVNDAPVAVGETISENEDTTLLISQAALLANDSDVDTATDGQVLSITVVSNAQHGTVTLNADGTISFVPEANFYGNASFDYTVDDGNGGQTTTMATIALANVDDAPVATGETINSREDEVLTITASALLQNDSDIDNAHADLAISRVQSGTGGTVSLDASGNVVFIPTANYNGTATFTYWVKDPDGLESNAVTTTVVLAAVNDAPSAQGETVTGASEDAVFNINKSTLLANDHDIDNADSELSLSWVGNATGGTVSLDANGDVVFTPMANFNGNATFEYKVRDPDGLESPVVQAVIPVAAVNDAPVAVDDQFTTYKNSTMTIAFNQLTGNDTDVDHDALTVSAVRDHANGHASIVNGQVQFVADAGFTGAASFDYLADDGHGGQTWATTYVDVKAPPNQYPTMTLKNFAVADGRFGYDVSASTIFTNGSQTFALHDDGPVSAISIKFLSASFVSPYPIWESSTDASKLAINWDSVNGVFSWNASALTWTIAGTPEPHWDGTVLRMTIQWELTDSQGLTNICTYEFNPYETGPFPDNETVASYVAMYNDMSNYAGFRNLYVYGTDQYAYVKSQHSGYYSPPIILDLNGDGTHYTSLVDSKVALDVNFDGIQDKMAWAGNDDGVLVWDKDHNHQITDASEFGFQTLKAGAQTDLEGLQALDTNGNGLLDAADDKFAEFAVWQDVNGNGVTDEGEFKTLTQLGIASINLHSNGQVHNAGTALANSGSDETDVTVMGTTVFTRTDGSTGHADDAMLAYEDGAAKQAEVNRQVLLFNQMCNTAIVHDVQPLGVIPIEPDVSLHDWVVLSATATSSTSLGTSNTTLHNT